jgi:hypothetical protein
MLRTVLYLHVYITRKTNGRCLGTFQTATLFRELGRIGQKPNLIHLVLKGFIKNKSLSWIYDINIEVRTNACGAVTIVSLIMIFPRLVKEKLFISVYLEICVQRETNMVRRRAGNARWDVYQTDVFSMSNLCL